MIRSFFFDAWKIAAAAIGGLAGWFASEFRPCFPLGAVVLMLILYDAYTAYRLDRRVHAAYPERNTKSNARFTSFAFGKVIRKTIPHRLWLILMAYAAERWVFCGINVSLSYIVAGAICIEQAWSVLENESSCRSEEDSRFWRVLQRVMIDKTARHFDVDLSALYGDRVTKEQADHARDTLRRYEEAARRENPSTETEQDKEQQNEPKWK